MAKLEFVNGVLEGLHEGGLDLRQEPGGRVVTYRYDGSQIDITTIQECLERRVRCTLADGVVQKIAPLR